MPPVFRRTAFLAVLLAAAGCKDSSGPPADRVTAVRAASGDLQGGVVAMALGQPVVALAVDAQDRPVRGALVEWAVTSGGGTIVPIETTTSDAGRASATWTLGQNAGEQSATITIGTATYTFRATGIAGQATTVTVTPAAIVLEAIDATSALSASARDQFDNPISGRPFTWTSQNTSIASVSSTGIVTAESTGNTTVQAQLDGATGSASVTVSPRPVQVTLNPTSANLTAAGQTVQFVATSRDINGNTISLQPADYTWTTSSASVVTVSTTGLATATGSGVALVTARIGTVGASAQVTVTQTASSIIVSPQLDTLTTALPTRQLTVVARDANNQIITNPALTWASADNTIATVTNTGLVTAVKNGTVYIRVTSGTVSDSAKIVVRLNAAPKAVNDTYGAIIDTPLVITAPGVLMNDTLGVPSATVVSFGGGSLAGTVASNPAGSTTMFGTGGSLRVTIDGSIAFTPSTGFNGPFTFMYRIQNAGGVSDATVTIQVGNPPAATDDAYMTLTSTTLNVAAPGVLGNDNLGFPVAAVSSFGGGSLGGTVTSFAAGQLVAFGIGGFVGGQIRLMADGTLSFTPPTGYNGVFTVQYRMASATGFSDATITITIAPVPDP